MPRFRQLGLDGVVEIVPDKFGDDRGFFSEVYHHDVYRTNGVDAEFIQDNHSVSTPVGVLRGLHFQLPPFAQAKLVRVVEGAVFDVAVDIRRGSPTYGQWVGLEISAAGWNQLYIPVGFAHGFVTLEPNTAFLYKVSAPYAPDHDRSIRYDDPEIGIDWPVDTSKVIVSAKDEAAKTLAETDTGFTF